jgi:hypothetical protein
LGIRRTLALVSLTGLLLTGCMTIGRPFPTEPIRGLEIGATTRQQVRDRFGPPWRTGIENGEDTLTYGHYRYSLFGPPRASDLVLRFDARGVLSSYNYSTTGD